MLACESRDEIGKRGIEGSNTIGEAEFAVEEALNHLISLPLICVHGDRSIAHLQANLGEVARFRIIAGALTLARGKSKLRIYLLESEA